MAELTLLAALGSLLLLVIQVIERRRWRYGLDARRIGDLLATRLLISYRGQMDQLGEEGVKRYARERYLEAAAEIGLPAGAADAVADRAWRWVEESREERARRSFYGD